MVVGADGEAGVGVGAATVAGGGVGVGGVTGGTSTAVTGVATWSWIGGVWALSPVAVLTIEPASRSTAVTT